VQTTDVRALKKDPSQALRMAREAGPVLIMKGDEPDALLVHLGGSPAATEDGIRPALAASLYRDGCLSLGRAAEVSGLSLSDFISHLDSLGIDVVRWDETMRHETGDASRPARVAARMRAQGLRPVHFWVPDTRTAAFRTEARRQASATALSAQEPEDQAFIDAVSDRTET
jgi:hypothetical protein